MEDGVSLSWKERGITSEHSIDENLKRNPNILRYVSDVQNRTIYDRLVLPENTQFELMNRKKFADHFKHAVAAVRCAVPHTVRWLVPNADKDKPKGRFVLKNDYPTLLTKTFFKPLKFQRPEAAAANFVLLVIRISNDHIGEFSPKHVPKINAYPNVDTEDEKTNKTVTTTVDSYLTRFTFMWGWFHLAKAVAMYVHFELEN